MGVSKLKIPKVCEHCGKAFEARTFNCDFFRLNCRYISANMSIFPFQIDLKQLFSFSIEFIDYEANIQKNIDIINKN